MKKAPTFATAASFALAAICAHGDARAGDVTKEAPAPIIEPAAAERLEWKVTALTEYTASASLSNHRLGSQDALHSNFQIDSAIPIGGGFYADAGVFYERFDFGTSLAPVPTTLHAVGSKVGVQWRFEGETAALLQLSPGFYGSEFGDSDDFNIPVAFGFAFKPSRNFAVGAGLYYNQFRTYQITPLVGFRWIINKEWRVTSRLPDLNVIYSPNDDWAFDIGARSPGGGFKNATGERNRPGRKFDYVEIRARAGVRYEGFKPLSLYLTAGWSFIRRFRYEEFDEEYKTDGAPYVGLEAGADF